MSRSSQQNGRGNRRERHVSVRAVRRSAPDVPKLSRALIRLAMEQAAAEAAAQQASEATPSAKPARQERADD